MITQHNVYKDKDNWYYSDGIMRPFGENKIITTSTGTIFSSVQPLYVEPTDYDLLYVGTISVTDFDIAAAAQNATGVNFLKQHQLERLPTKRLLTYYKKHRGYRHTGKCDCCGECNTKKERIGNYLCNRYLNMIKSILNTREHVI